MLRCFELSAAPHDAPLVEPCWTVADIEDSVCPTAGTYQLVPFFSNLDAARIFSELLLRGKPALEWLTDIETFVRREQPSGDQIALADQFMRWKR